MFGKIPTSRKREVKFLGELRVAETTYMLITSKRMSRVCCSTWRLRYHQWMGSFSARALQSGRPGRCRPVTRREGVLVVHVNSARLVPASVPT